MANHHCISTRLHPRITSVRRVLVSDPVDPVDGQLFENHDEFLLPGLLPFSVSRSYEYNALNRGIFGNNWLCALDQSLRVDDESGDIIYCNEVGRDLWFFRPVGDEAEQNAAARNYRLLNDRDDGFLLLDGDLEIRFGVAGPKRWQLDGIVDIRGAKLLFHRSEAGYVERIEQTEGNSLQFCYNAEGLCTQLSLRNPRGEECRIANFSYDAQGNLVASDNAYGPSRGYQYDAHNRLMVLRDGARTESRFTYDEAGRVALVRSNGAYDGDRFIYSPEERTTTYLPNGEEARSIRYVFDASGNVVETHDAIGAVTKAQFNGNREVVAEIDGEGNETSYGYSGGGNLESVRDGEGRSTYYFWTYHDKLRCIMDEDDNKTRFIHDDDGALVTIQDALGHTTEIINNAYGQPERTMRHDGLMEICRYDEWQRLAEVMDFRGEVTRFERDGFGRLTGITDPSGAQTRLSYAEGANFWQPCHIERADGVVVSRGHDRAHATTTVTDGEGRRTVYRHGPFDVLAEIEDSRGGKLRFDYDGQKRLLAVTNQQGREWTFERDVAGRVVRECDFDELAIDYAYDKAGRVIEARHCDGARLTYAYDKSGLLVREELFEADASEPQLTEYAYDDRGLVQSAKNACAEVKFARDKMGRVISETVNGREVANTFDCCGNRTSRTIGGRLVETLYDPLGAIKQLTIDEHAPLVFKRNAVGRETRRESGSGFHLDQAYDGIGQLIAQGSRQREAGPLAAHRFGVSPQEPGRSIERRYTWSKAFEPETITEALWGETAYRYDAIGQVTETRFGDGDGERFGYDAALNIAGFAEGPAPEQPAWAKGVAGSGWRPPTAAHFSWSLSEGGRVKLAHGPKGEKVFLSYDARGRVIERKVERDGFRTKIWRYGWDGNNRLVTCVTQDQHTWHYGYDPFERRLWKKRELTEAEKRYYARKYPQAVGQADREWHYSEPTPVRGISLKEEVEGLAPVVGVAYHWDGDVLAEEAPLRLDGSVDWDKATRWHYEPGTFRPLAKEEPIQGERGDDKSDGPVHRLLYIVTDHLGTPREMLAENGNVVWAASYTTWGRVRGLRIAPANDNDDDGPTYRGLGAYYHSDNLALKPAPEEAAFDCPIRFQGQWEDVETGLYYNRFRYYDPLAGQYMSPDPIGLSGGLRAQSYVPCPTSWIDPLGLAYVDPNGVVVVTLSQSRFQDATQHIQDATTKMNKPSLLTLDRPGAAARRKAACCGHKKVPPKQLDEYPPAIAKEGGANASVRLITGAADNGAAGASMGNQLRPYPDGTKFRIEIVP